MLRYLIGVCLCLGSTSFIFAQGIKFEKGSWEDVLAKAQQENKPVFVDAYTSWCGPCKWMAREVFTQEEVGTYVNAHFIAYKMDMEKGDGPAFAKKNGIKAYPTLLYFDSQGGLLHKAMGARTVEQLLQLCEDALNPEKQVGSYHKRYNNGTRDADFLKQYVHVLAEAGEDFEAPFEEYWATLKEEEHFNEGSLDLLAQLTRNFSDAESPWTTYFMKNSAAYQKNVEQETVDYYMMYAYGFQVYHLAKLEDNPSTQAKVEELLTLFPKGRNDFKARWKFYKAALATPPNDAKIARLKKRYLKKTIDKGELNEAAWKVMSKEEPQKKELKNALQYINRSIDMDKNYYSLHIKAMILSKLAKSQEATEIAKSALEEAKEAGLNTEETQRTVDLIESLK